MFPTGLRLRSLVEVMLYAVRFVVVIFVALTSPVRGPLNDALTSAKALQLIVPVGDDMLLRDTPPCNNNSPIILAPSFTPKLPQELRDGVRPIAYTNVVAALPYTPTQVKIALIALKFLITTSLV